MLLELSCRVWVAPGFEFEILLIASVSSVFIFCFLLREMVEWSSPTGIQKLTCLIPDFHHWEHRKPPLLH